LPKEALIKVLFLSVPCDINYKKNTGDLPVMPKIAIVCLIKWMEKSGYIRENYDYYDIDMLSSTNEEILNYVLKTKPDVVGISAVVSTTYDQVKRISRLVRQACPDSWIVLGGNMAASANVILNKTAVDICVQGDGEIPLVEFLEYVKKNGKNWNYDQLYRIRGLSYLDSNRDLRFNGFGEMVPADAIPFPDYEILALGLKGHLEALKNYFRIGSENFWFIQDSRTFEAGRRPNLAQFWVSKGCVAKCTFCQRTNNKYRIFNLDAMEEHVKLLRDKHDVGFISVLDENFGSNRKYTHDVVKTFNKYNMLWIAGGVRCKSVNGEDAKFYKENGCCGLKFGVESGSQKILDMMEKRFTVQDVFNARKYCVEQGIYSPIAIMLGMPGDNEKTVLETGEFLGNMVYMEGLHPKKLGFDIMYALPLVGTPLYEYGQQIGVIGKGIDEEERYLESVSDSGASKLNYVNLNGSSIKDIVFWEFLVLFEATRAYLKNVRHYGKHNLVNQEFRHRIVNELWQKNRWSRIRKVFSKNPMFFSKLLRYILVYSDFLASLPRSLVYPVVKNLLLFEFILMKLPYTVRAKLVPGAGIPSIFKAKQSLLKLNIDETEIKPKNMSLRHIVSQSRSHQILNSITEKNDFLIKHGSNP